MFTVKSFEFFCTFYSTFVSAIVILAAVHVLIISELHFESKMSFILHLIYLYIFIAYIFYSGTYMLTVYILYSGSLTVM